jgi:hypothetical protein
MTTFRTVRLSGAIVLLVALIFVSTAVAAAGGGGLAGARAATAKFHDLSVAMAAGYNIRVVDVAGISCIENQPEGAMGVHYVNGDLLLDNPPGSPPAVDALRPEALVYEPKKDGKLKLVALEYIVFKEAWDANNASPPSLFGQEFGVVESPNRYGLSAFYELHAWIWKPNPSGMFYEWNPRVSCQG